MDDAQTPQQKAILTVGDRTAEFPVLHGTPLPGVETETTKKKARKIVKLQRAVGVSCMLACIYHIPRCYRLARRLGACAGHLLKGRSMQTLVVGCRQH